MEYHFFKRISFYIMSILAFIGFLYFLAPKRQTIEITYYVVSVVLIMFGFYKFLLLFVDTEKKDLVIDHIEMVLSFIVGIVALVLGRRYPFVPVILGIVYLIMPIVIVILSKEKIKDLLMNALKIAIGVFYIVSFDQMSTPLCIFIGLLYEAGAVTIFLFKMRHLMDSKRGLYNE